MLPAMLQLVAHSKPWGPQRDRATARRLCGSCPPKRQAKPLRDARLGPLEKPEQLRHAQNPTFKKQVNRPGPPGPRLSDFGSSHAEKIEL